MIEIERVTKRYGKLLVLKAVSCFIEDGQVVVIIGPSGSGKTTLLRCINGLEEIDSGQITIDGIRITKDNFTQVRKQVGMVFQSFNLFPHLTAIENVILAQKIVKKKEEKKAKFLAWELLEKVGLKDKVDQYPRQLSGGEQQRVAIARALAMEPKIMLFDEPTSALDPEMTKEVLEVMMSLAKEGMSMILVSHEMGFVRKVTNQIIFLDEGKILEKGTPQEIFENPKLERTKKFISQIL